MFFLHHRLDRHKRVDRILQPHSCASKGHFCKHVGRTTHMENTMISTLQNTAVPLIRPLCDFTSPRRDVDDPNCLFQNHWLNKGNCGLILSSSGIGKSSFTIQAAVLWAKGEPMLGIRPTRPLKTLIMQTEDDDHDICLFRNGTRIGLTTELGWDVSTIREAESMVLVRTTSGMTSCDFFATLTETLQATHPDLVIINPLHAYFDGSISESHACSEFFRKGLDPIIRDSGTKCGVLIVHHTGKPKENFTPLSAAYMGNGSAELTNYPRSILAIRPDKKEGFFTLIGAKHGDRLKWRNENGRITTTKTICYANRLPRYSDKQDVIFWVEPTPEDSAALTTSHNNVKDDTKHNSKKDNDKGDEENALILVRHVESHPPKTITNAALREYAGQQWTTLTARKAVKHFEEIRSSYGIGKEDNYYTHCKAN